MENNIKKRDPFEKTIVLSVVSAAACALLLILVRLLLWRYFKYPTNFEEEPEYIRLSLSSLTIIGVLIGTVSVYNFTSFIFRFNDVSKSKYIIGLIVSFIIMVLIISFLILGWYRYGIEDLTYKKLS